MCMLVQVYQHVHKSSNNQTINFHQAYIIILIQHFNNFTIHLKVTRQWPFAAAKSSLAAAKSSLAAAEQQSHRSDKHLPLGLSNPSQPYAVWTILAAMSVFYLNNQTQHSNCTSLTIIRACSFNETHSHSSECSQYQKFINWTHSLQRVLTSPQRVLMLSKKP